MRMFIICSYLEVTITQGGDAMKLWIRLSIALLIVLLIVPMSAMAYEIPSDFTELTIDQAMEEFMQSRGLNESNYSVSFCNTVTGERYAFNDKKFMVAGSTYKLPLNMHYYNQEHAGVIDPDVYISRVGATLKEAHYQSLVHSNNDMSIGMLYNLGQFRDYKNAMKAFFSMPEEEIDPIYYVDNHYCTNMMMDALSYLYEYRADFDEMIGYMKQAQPGEYFKAGVTQYEVAHKYGWFEGAVNDVGIIYTPQPILLAVFTQDVGAQVVADTAALFTAYTVWQQPPEDEGAYQLDLKVQHVPEEVPEEEQPAIQQTPADPVVSSTVEEKTHVFEWWMLIVALGVFCLGGGLTVLLVNPHKLKKYEDKAEERLNKLNKE